MPAVTTTEYDFEGAGKGKSYILIYKINVAKMFTKIRLTIRNLLSSLCPFHFCGIAFTAVQAHFDLLIIFKAKEKGLYKPPDTSLPAEGAPTGLPLRLLLVSCVEKAAGYEMWSCAEQKR